MATRIGSAQEAIQFLDALPDEITNLLHDDGCQGVSSVVAQAEDALKVLKNSVTLNRPTSRRAPKLNGNSR